MAIRRPNRVLVLCSMNIDEALARIRVVRFQTFQP